MTGFYDLCNRETSGELREFADELGWNGVNGDFEAVFLDADDWGELKQKIRNNREDADVLIFRGGDEELNRKAASDSRVDVLLHPEKGRKDSGINHVVAEEAAENKVAIGFDFSMLETSSKKRSHVLSHWRRNLKLAEKYDAPYIITTGAREKYDLRPPRDLAAIIDSLGYNGIEAVKHSPSKIIERSRRAGDEKSVRPGETVE